VAVKKQRTRRIPAIAGTDPYQSALAAGLRYVTGAGPGISRKRAGKGFVYIGVDGKPVRDREELKRIQALVIPPAWTNVWICPSPKGHLQAVGRDARGRKQYRYHTLYRQVRDQTKFGRMIAFAQALPRIRRRVEEDLKLPGLPKDKVLAAVVRLLETTCMRIGNEEYARDNASFGLTTLQDRHVRIFGHTMKFKFRGKSGQEHEIELDDKRLSKIVKQCQDIPGYELFQYIDDDGRPCDVGSSNVNTYLREITGEDFTAKDFRTWAGTGLAAQALAEIGPGETQTESKKQIVAAIKSVAKRLGNRPATCKAYYVHPAIIESYQDGTLFEAMRQTPKSCPDGLQPNEFCVMALVEVYEKKARKAA
jgi:DNA topoisomerase-1